MRIALLSDIHGNPIALDAVLEDAHAAGVDQFWILGDFAAIGPDPVAVLERVATLGHTLVTRGNTDRYVVTDDRPPPSLETVRGNPDLIPMYAGIGASMAWTRGYVTAQGWFDWLERLPLEVRVTSPEGIRLLCVHAFPGSDDREGIHASSSNEQIGELIADCDADVVFVGHTHEPLVRRIGPVVVVNLGSVSNPRTTDLRASYVLLELSHSHVELEHRRVAYDTQAFIESVYRSRHPAAEFILSYQRGQQLGRKPHPDHIPVTLGEKVKIRIPLNKERDHSAASQSH